MSRRLGWLLGAAVVLTAVHSVVLAVYPGALPGAGVTSDVRPPSDNRQSDQRLPDAVLYDEAVVTIEIPAAADVPTGGPHGGNCPQDQLCNILGVTLAKPHGLVVETVVPEGPAARAGIEPGDRLGTQRDCPSTSLGLYRPHSQPRQVEVTVRRPASEKDETPRAEESASGEASEE